MKTKIVITGMGAVTPIGNTVNEFTEALFSGVSGASRLTRFDPAGLNTLFAAEVKNIKHQYKDVKITYAQRAAAEAMRQSFATESDYNPKRSQLSVGIGLELFSMPDLIQSQSPGFNYPAEHQDAMTFLNTPSDLCAHMLSEQYNFKAAPMIHISACSASTDAIGTAYEAIEMGQMDVVLAGGTDSMINPMGLGGFSRIGALSTRNDAPEFASRPFDRDRDGFVLGEGAGFLVLESFAHAKARGATILAEVSGYANSLDAYSVSDPHPEGLGALQAMRAALQSAELDADAISAVNAHGTSTAKNDPVEVRALQALFANRISDVPVSSTKSMTGHLISASGAVESIAVVQCLRKQRMHHTANLENIADDCQLNHVQHESIPFKLEHILKNSFGFGGKNACLIFSAHH